MIKGHHSVFGSLNLSGGSGNLEVLIESENQPRIITLGTFTVGATTSLQEAGIDRVRIILFVNGLFEMNTAKGSVFGSSVKYKFEIYDGLSTYFLADASGRTEFQIAGKVKSKYQRAHTITLPKFKSDNSKVTGCTIKIIRITPNDTERHTDAGSLVKIYNKLYYESYQTITDYKLNYPNTALVALEIDPAIFSSIPKRSYLVGGLKIKVPSNYDPATRTYTGVWDGSLVVKGATDNPAWVMYDILTDKRYGLGAYGVLESQVDKAMLYKIGRYCDEQVSNGVPGQTEPRFSVNVVIQKEEDAERVINDIASIFRGMTYWNGSMFCFKQDSPCYPSMIFTQANVVEGNFGYAGTARKDRHSVVHVKYTDPDQNYKQSIEYVEDRELIEKIGIRKLEIDSFGCTSRSQAHRVGKWALYSEKYESQMITFKAGLDASLLLPGEVVMIYDSFKANRRMSGRITSATLTSVTCDNPIKILTAAKIYIATEDGSFKERDVLEAPNASYTTFTWTTPLDELPVNNAVFAVSDSTIGVSARVVMVKQERATPNIFTVVCVKHDPNKYNTIESELKIEGSQVTQIGYDPYVEKVFVEAYWGTSNNPTLEVSWVGMGDLFKIEYRVTKKVVTVVNSISTITYHEENWDFVETTSQYVQLKFDEPYATGDIIDIKVSAKNQLNRWSTPTAITPITVGQFGTVPSIGGIPTYNAPYGPGILDFNTLQSRLFLTKPPITSVNIESDTGSIRITATLDPNKEYDFKYLEVYESTTDTSTKVKVGVTEDGVFTRTGLAKNTTRYYWFRAVNQYGSTSPYYPNRTAYGLDPVIDPLITGKTKSSDQGFKLTDKKVKGTAKRLLSTIELEPNTYKPRAYFGCENATHIATVKIIKQDGTLLATLGGTAGGMRWNESPTTFELTATTTIKIIGYTNSASGVMHYSTLILGEGAAL